jgi:hypothetical protein
MKSWKNQLLPKDEENVTNPKNNHQTERRKVPEQLIDS